jgi:hypothetical protein
MTWGAPRAWAQGAGWENEPESDRFVVLEAPASIDPELEESLRELLQRNHFRLVHPAVVRASRVFALVRIELHQGDATVTITDGSGKSPAVQREVYGSESAAVFRETLAHIILGSVEPLAVSRATPPSQIDEGVPHPVRESGDANSGLPAPAPSTEGKPHRVSVALGYRGGPLLVSTNQGTVAFGAQGTVTLESALRPSLSIDASYVIPPRVTDGGLNASIGLVPLRLRAAIEAYAWPSLALETALVGGVDLVSLSPSSSDPSLQVAPETRRVQPIVGAAIAGRSHLAPTLDLVIGLGLDVDLAPRRWLVASDLTSSSFFELARVRPSASLGIMWTFSGAPPQVDAPTVARAGAHL